MPLTCHRGRKCAERSRGFGVELPAASDANEQQTSGGIAATRERNDDVLEWPAGELATPQDAGYLPAAGRVEAVELGEIVVLEQGTARRSVSRLAAGSDRIDTGSAWNMCTAHSNSKPG